MGSSSNFQFLAEHSPLLADLGTTAERLFPFDPSSWVRIDEAATWQIIDLQLTEAGWHADKEQLTHAKDTRPERGKNKAIAEWSTRGQQSADYVLFTRLTPMAAVEAKRQNINVPGNIPQAERYARGFTQVGDHEPAAGRPHRPLA